MTSPTPENRQRVNRSEALIGVLGDLRDAGSSMTLVDFKRALAKHYSTPDSMKCALKTFKARGFIQVRVMLTASGSAHLCKTEDTRAKLLRKKSLQR